MKPWLVFPYHDPEGKLLPHLEAILPDLYEHFAGAYVCPPADTRRNKAVMKRLEADGFFTIFPLGDEVPIGAHLARLYLKTALAAPAEAVLHLAFVDRLAYALAGEHREMFLAEVDTLTPDDLPLIFQRSAAAWVTHPQNYARLENFVMQVGAVLFGRRLEWGWCHLVVQAGELRQVMPKVTQRGLSMVAEIVLHLLERVKTREVDWLAWEDPFILGREAGELKAAREDSAGEYEKRLSYCLPMVEVLLRFARQRGE